MTNVTSGQTAKPGFPVGQPRSRAEQLALAIEDRIRDEGLPVGEPIGTLEDLRGWSGFSKPTVSEAVRLLRDRGVLEIKPGRGGGLFVADRGPVVRLRHTLLSVAQEPTAVADAVELRDCLELLVDLGAARCCSTKDIAELRDLVAVMGAAGDWRAFMAANWELHERIAAISPNAMARAVYTSTLGQISGTTPDYDNLIDKETYRHQRYLAHVELVEAIASGDEERIQAAVNRHNITSEEN